MAFLLDTPTKIGKPLAPSPQTLCQWFQCHFITEMRLHDLTLCAGASRRWMILPYIFVHSCFSDLPIY